VNAVYRAPTGGDVPDVMPPRERRRVDALVVGPDGQRRIVEFDLGQHFVVP
jgi:hypothetical protein